MKKYVGGCFFVSLIFDANMITASTGIISDGPIYFPRPKHAILIPFQPDPSFKIFETETSCLPDVGRFSGRGLGIPVPTVPPARERLATVPTCVFPAFPLRPQATDGSVDRLRIGNPQRVAYRWDCLYMGVAHRWGGGGLDVVSRLRVLPSDGVTYRPQSMRLMPRTLGSAFFSVFRSLTKGKSWCTAHYHVVFLATKLQFFLSNQSLFTT